MIQKSNVPDSIEKSTLAFVDDIVREIVGSNLGDENFAETPRRVAQSFVELLRGHSAESLSEIQKFLGISFETKHDEMVIIRGVQASGICPHHFLPVLYTIHFAYIPNGRALGLSKVPRIVKLMAARAALQEDVTSAIADQFYESESLNPRGVAVVVQGFHSCMSVRGTLSHDASTISSAMRGCFLDNADSSKLEFFQNLHLPGGVNWSGRG